MSKSKQRYSARKYQIIVLIVIFILAAGSTALAINQHAAQEKKKFKANLASISGTNQSLINIYSQYVQLPSSTTKTKSDWDSYYSGLISQVQDLANSTPKATFSDARLNKFATDVTDSANDFINLLNLEKSGNDMQFQVTDDQNQLNTDQSTLANEQQLYDSSVSEGIPIGNGYVTEFQAKVATDKQQISTDQQTQQDQQKQSSSLFNTVSQDFVQTTKDGQALGE